MSLSTVTRNRERATWDMWEEKAMGRSRQAGPRSQKIVSL